MLLVATTLSDVTSHKYVTEENDDVAQTGINIDTQFILRIVYYLIGAFGIVGNATVVIVLTKVNTQFRGNVRLFFIHQGVIDLVAALFLILTTLFQDTQDLLPGLAGEIQCKIWLTKLFLWSTFLSSTLNLCCITLERYFAVVRPLQYRLNSRDQKLVFPLCVCFIWLTGIVFNTYKVPTTIVVDGQCRVYGNWSSVQAKKTVGILNLFLYLVLPMILLIHCYSKMLSALRKQTTQIRPISEGQPNSNVIKFNQKAQRNIIKTLLWMSIMYFMCWVWNQVYFFLLNLGVHLDFANPFYHFTVVAVFLNCCVNPVLYIFKYRLYNKKAFRKFMGRNGQYREKRFIHSTAFAASLQAQSIGTVSYDIEHGGHSI